MSENITNTSQMTDYEKAITGTDQKKTEALIAMLSSAWSKTDERGI